MKRVVLGVIGHVDHGKTSLVRALTGQDTDRLPEEKARGISIALGFAHLSIGPDVEIDLIDMPGHERFVRTMIGGATGIDAVLLVVAANDGIKPQTVEHIDIAGLLELRKAVVAISKVDLVAPEQAARIADEAVRLLARSGLVASPPVMTSAVQGAGIAELRQTFEALAAEQAPHAEDGIAFLPIDRSFGVAGHGSVVTGTLRGAAVAVGDTLELFPSRRSVRVRGVQVHGARVTAGRPGQRVALNLRGVELADLSRGMALATPEMVGPSDWLTIAIRAVDGAPTLKNGKRLRALLGTTELDVRLRLLDRDALEAGESGFAQLHCAEPVALPTGEHVILRLASPARTVAGGRILEAETRRRRRSDPAILQRLDALSTLPPAEILATEVRQAGPAGTDLRHLSRLSALAIPRIVELLQSCTVTVTRSGLVVQTAELDELLRRLPPLLATQTTGLALSKLLSALPGTGAAVLDEALARLTASGAITKRGDRFLIPRPEDDRARSDNEAALASRIAGTLREGGLAPPDPAAMTTDPRVRRVLDRLVRDGVVVRAVDRAKGKEILFHQTAIAEAKRRLAPLLGQEPGLLVTEIGAALGISRKYSMPLLDHLDTIQFTRRVKDRRVLAPSPPVGGRGLG